MYRCGVRSSSSRSTLSILSSTLTQATSSALRGHRHIPQSISGAKTPRYNGTPSMTLLTEHHDHRLAHRPQGGHTSSSIATRAFNDDPPISKLLMVSTATSGRPMATSSLWALQHPAPSSISCHRMSLTRLIMVTCTAWYSCPLPAKA
jgi:hypothetical protein